MGLETLELLMMVEDEFNIVIPDVDAQQTYTVGNFVDLVYARLRHNEDEPCPAENAFQIVQQTIARHLDIACSQITLNTRLDNIIGRKNRRTQWQAILKSLTGEEVPSEDLIRPFALRMSIYFIIPAIAFWYSWNYIPFAVAIFFAFASAVAGVLLTVPFRTELPGRFQRAEDLIKLIATLDEKTWSYEEVYHKIRGFIVEVAGVKEEEVTLEAHFINDLGFG